MVAPDQAAARRYLEVVRGWIPAVQAVEVAQLATSDTPRAHEVLAAFRLRPEPSILVTVAMAYEGLDAPEVAVVAALTHIRSRPWLEQMVARATRVDPHAGPYEAQGAMVFHPDDPLFAQFRRRMEIEQGTLARRPKPGRPESSLPLWLLYQLGPPKPGIVPLSSNALALRFDTLRPGPELALRLLLLRPAPGWSATGWPSTSACWRTTRATPGPCASAGSGRRRSGGCQRRGHGRRGRLEQRVQATNPSDRDTGVDTA